MYGGRETESPRLCATVDKLSNNVLEIRNSSERATSTWSISLPYPVYLHSYTLDFGPSFKGVNATFEADYIVGGSAKLENKKLGKTPESGRIPGTNEIPIKSFSVTSRRILQLGDIRIFGKSIHDVWPQSIANAMISPMSLLGGKTWNADSADSVFTPVPNSGPTVPGLSVKMDPPGNARPLFNSGQTCLTAPIKTFQVSASSPFYLMETAIETQPGQSAQHTLLGSNDESTWTQIEYESTSQNEALTRGSTFKAMPIFKHYQFKDFAEGTVLCQIRMMGNAVDEQDAQKVMASRGQGSAIGSTSDATAVRLPFVLSLAILSAYLF